MILNMRFLHYLQYLLSATYDLRVTRTMIVFLPDLLYIRTRFKNVTHTDVY